mgnify:CR=1 FL=1
MGATAVVNTNELAAIDKELAKIQAIHRMGVVRKGVNRSLTPPSSRVKENLPKPGYPGDKPGLKPLRETLGKRVVDYPSGKVVGVLGYRYPAGAHGHLVEEGHELVIRGESRGNVEGKHYIDQAATATEGQQKAILDRTVGEAVDAARR